MIPTPERTEAVRLAMEIMDRRRQNLLTEAQAAALVHELGLPSLLVPKPVAAERAPGRGMTPGYVSQEPSMLSAVRDLAIENAAKESE